MSDLVSKPPEQNFRSSQVRPAYRIVTTPEANHARTLRALAWRTLMAERGLRCNAARLERLARIGGVA